MIQPRLRLGVNIDHIATLRNARGEGYPDLLRAAAAAKAGGADGLTAHLREDRRHILDQDIVDLKTRFDLPLNMEMAPTEEMIRIACEVRPHAVCLVPEKREELTTEGGLLLKGQAGRLTPTIERLAEAGARVSLFIEPNEADVKLAEAYGAGAIELHTGRYCHLVLTGDHKGSEKERQAIEQSALTGHDLGLEVHAGHGLTFASTPAIARIPTLSELNIGHFLIAEAVFSGLESAVRHIRLIMDKARSVNQGLKT